MDPLPHPPQLASPGAGIPVIEKFVGSLLLSARRAFLSRSKVDADFAKERDLILALNDKCPSEQANTPVLIRRIIGIEDSSRYWSVRMTLDHLRIVNMAFMGIIRSLGKGIVPTRPADTAAVKPSSNPGPDVVETFRQSCDIFLKAAQAISNLKTAARFSHPWFGSLDAAGWHTMGSVHMKIHRTQIELILKGLEKPV